jgi:N-acetyl-anhydromuramyl-L-alanine amidase AmpD
MSFASLGQVSTRRLVIDRTTYSYDGNGRELSIVNNLVLHRCSLAAVGIDDSLLDAETLAAAFGSHDELRPVTGGRPPYHFLVRLHGAVEQVLPIRVRGSHAGRHNASSIGVAVVGDTRRRPMTAGQARGLVGVLAALVPYAPVARIVGHTQLDGATSDPGKVCPGEHIQVPSIAAAVVRALPEGWRAWSRERVSAELALSGVREGA